ncbi:MAG: hypothetical protein JWP38_800 [Herbaspirillum sp.]|jgi:hypothetical protein|nr:hypothetical protein [Herbaspirillum sp.]
MKKSVDRWIWITYLVMPLLLSWPAWVNGQAFFFTDTTAYIKGAASAVQLVFPSAATRAWLEHDGSAAPQGSDPLQAQLQAQADKFTSSPDKNGVLAGRSIYYGFCVFLLSALFGFKAVPIAQALLAVATVSTFLRSRFELSHRTVCAALLPLAVASPLPFFNSMVMPDVFAGLGMCAVLALMLTPRASPGNKIFWSAVTMAAVLFHTSNILILLGVVGALILLKLLLRQKLTLPARGVILALVLIGVGICGEVMFGLAVERVTHTEPIRPPFMTARLLADGPGNLYVARYCPQAGFEVCRYQRDFTKGGSDDFLWNLDPRSGVFTLASKQSREKLSHEDLAFSKAVAAAYPMETLKSALVNIGKQVSYIGLSEFNYSPEMVTGFGFKLPDEILPQMRGTLAAHAAFDVRYSEILIKAGAIASLFLCLAALAPLWKRKDFTGVTLILAVLAAMLINAIVCGTLSTPHDRYQARVIWLLELTALVIALFYFGLIRRKTSPSGIRDMTAGVDDSETRGGIGDAPLPIKSVVPTGRHP